MAFAETNLCQNEKRRHDLNPLQPIIFFNCVVQLDLYLRKLLFSGLNNKFSLVALAFLTISTIVPGTASVIFTAPIEFRQRMTLTPNFHISKVCVCTMHL
jgi:hypothetical protein